MSNSISGAPGSRDGMGRDSWRRIVMAFAVAASSVCLGGAAAIVAISRGASTALSLSLMATVIVCGGLAALVMTRQGRRTSGGPREQTLLERQLTARYGVPVEQLTWHVWRIDGELIEATLDPQTGYLTAGGRELQL